MPRKKADINLKEDERIVCVYCRDILKEEDIDLDLFFKTSLFKENKQVKHIKSCPIKLFNIFRLLEK